MNKKNIKLRVYKEFYRLLALYLTMRKLSEADYFDSGLLYYFNFKKI
jgi:hypothetical protein